MPKTNCQQDNGIRVEKHLIRPSSPCFAMLRDFCHRAKNLYNHANYIVRKAFIENGNWIRYQELDEILKADAAYPDYKDMPTAQAAQQTLRLVDKDWKSFFAAIKDWKNHKDKYLGRPKLPRYKRKDGLTILVLTNQNCKLNGNVLKFPRTFNGFTIKPKFVEKEYVSFQQVRFIPTGTDIVAEVVYKIKDVPLMEDTGRYAGIDIGVNNLLTMATNTEHRPMIVNGRIPKSANQFYNKKLAHRRELCQRMNGKHSSKSILRLTGKRNRRMDDYMHKASRRIVKECAERGVSTIVIGKNNGWKQGSSLSSRINQHFVQMPFARLIEMIEYKAREYGIAVILTEESYTSGTSVLDNEMPEKAQYDKSRRIRRGLLRSNSGRCINADVNGACQILKKVFPNAFADGIEGVVLRPVVVAAA